MSSVLKSIDQPSVDFAPLQASIIQASISQASISQACARIAPTWPLDQFIAVNPYWGFVDQPIAQAARQMNLLSGTPLVMPRSFYLDEWRAKRLRPEHLQAAINQAKAHCTVDDLIEGMSQATKPAQRLRLMTTLADEDRDLHHAMSWVDFVTHQISQHCAAYFDENQASWNPEKIGLYASWAKQLRSDHSTALLMGYTSFNGKADQLPSNPHELIAKATKALQLKTEQCADYYSALLMSINGWASWCAYRRWQARLGTVAGQTDDDAIVELLAIRLGWEWLLLQNPSNIQIASNWLEVVNLQIDTSAAFQDVNKHDWLLQNALELAFQKPLFQALMGVPTLLEPAPTVTLTVTPTVQAIFCIDVRSEVYRRALEASSTAIQTRGFAGFFGLFISYSPTGTAMARPQLPGLLASNRCVTDECDSQSLGQAIANRRKSSLQWRSALQNLRITASSGFSFVETCGLLYAGKLFKSTLPNDGASTTVEQMGLSNAQIAAIRPRLQPLSNATEEIELQSRCDMAAGILGAIGVTKDFARIVLLAGHGSQNANNPHAAGLDCGACGGQTGEVNARVLAALLNDVSVRNGLVCKGIFITESTWFLGGLHNTTTDDLTLFDTDLIPASHAADLEQLKKCLLLAGRTARAERAPTLGLEHLIGDAERLEVSLKQRANDWAQVRPEWGLANNAAFIVAPRCTSQHLNLGGRAFLHDYDFDADTTLGVLELIMTAPMVVTNWINMQYYASVVDNIKYGSGNKVLHNVVGGRLGVFEGNGGDLRIGLPMQSLHDGKQWVHMPLRLSVFIEAPQAAIDSIIAKHEVVRQLVHNQWLHLFQIDGQTQGLGFKKTINRRTASGWRLEP